MPAVRLSISKRTAERRIAALSGRRLRFEVLDSASLRLRDLVRRAITQGASPQGTAHVPNVRGTPVLRDTGRLLNSIVSRVDRAATQATVGTNVVYAAAQQFGGTVGRGAKLPARPFLPLSADGSAVYLPSNWRNSMRRAIDRRIERLNL